MRQNEHEPVPIDGQIALLKALGEGKFDDVPLAEMQSAEQSLYKNLKTGTSE